MVISIILTVTFLFGGVVLLIIVTPAIIIVRVFDWSGRTSHTLGRWYLAILSYLMGVRVTIEGREHLDRKQPYLIIANHKSSMDILVLARVLPTHFKFFAASFLFSIPLLGWDMFMAGYLPVNRSKRTDAYKSVMKGINLLKDGKASLLIFPEGTRTPKPVIQHFKTGFLRIATETQQPILPVVLDGTAEIKKKHDFWYHPSRVKIKILPPIPTEGLTKKDWPALRTAVESRFQTEYKKIHEARAKLLQSKRRRRKRHKRRTSA